jgi:hypothetical protein
MGNMVVFVQLTTDVLLLGWYSAFLIEIYLQFLFKNARFNFKFNLSILLTSPKPWGCPYNKISLVHPLALGEWLFCSN